MQASSPKEIIDSLSRDESATTIVIAPGAPAVLRRDDGSFEVTQTITSSKEVADLLGAFRSYAHIVDKSVTRSAGCFAFPVPKVGRFRVDYMIQRGSYVMMVSRASTRVPAFEDLLVNSDPAVRLLEMILRSQLSLVTLFGVTPAANAAFIYAMLERINKSVGVNRLICTVEQSLRYLVQHHNSIVLQCEADTDVPSIEAGVLHVIGLRPDILYVGGVQSEDDLKPIRAAIGRGILTIISSTALDHAYMAARLPSTGYVGTHAALNPRWMPVTLLADELAGKFNVKLGFPAQLANTSLAQTAASTAWN